jgi:hypothetical protein
MPSFRIRWTLAVAALALSGSAATLAPRGDSSPLYRSPDARTANAVPSELAAALPVFQRDAGAQDVPPPLPDYSGPPGHPAPPVDGPQPFGANAALARRVRDGLFLIAGSTGVCFRSASHAEDGCQPLANVLSGDDSQSIICSPYLDPDVRETFGILPGDVRDASVTFADGTSRALPVVNGTYIVQTRVPAPLATTIAWDDGRGRHVVGTSMPADANDERCARPEDIARLPHAP